MKKLLIVLISVLCVSALAHPWQSHAQTSSDIESKIADTQKQRDALLEQQKKLQTALNEINKEGQTLQGTVKTLDVTKQKLANDLKITQTSISKANLTIQKLESDIKANETIIEDSQSAIEESLRKLANYDSHSIIFDLLTYNSLTDVWNDTGNLLTTQDALGSQVNALTEAQKKLTQNKSAKEGEKSQLVSLSSELSGQKKVVEATQTAKIVLLAETKSKEALYQKMLADNIAKEKEFEAQLFQYESQLKASNPAETPTADHGTLSWPLLSITVTQQFGRTSSSGPTLLLRHTQRSGLPRLGRHRCHGPARRGSEGHGQHR
jgi:peptidoglycan hydrolase CwlO-like protein